MTRPLRLSLAALLLLIVLGAAASYYFLSKAPPRAARLLPEADALLYVNLAPIRAVTHFDKNPLTRSPDFQRFIDATGIVPERDLDSAAFALHRMSDPNGPNGPVAFSEVFTGHFDSGRLAAWLATNASARETYAGHQIFTIPTDIEIDPHGAPPAKPRILRQLRVVLLSRDTIAASNAPTTEQIHSILDRMRTSILPTLTLAGPSLLARLYPEVPGLSVAWGVGQLGLPFSSAGKIAISGFDLPISAESTLIFSARYVGQVQVRLEDLTGTSDEAARTSQSLNSILAFVRAVEQTQLASTRPAGSAIGQIFDIKQITDSIKVEQQDTRVSITGSMPDAVAHHLLEP